MNLIATTVLLNLIRDSVLGTSYEIGYFRIGEGGWRTLNGARVPRSPDPALTDIDCLENPSRYPASRRRSYQKTLTSSDITHTEDGVLVIACELDLSEGNDPAGADTDPPEYYEIGVFTSDDDMIYYCTFPKFEKLSDRVFRVNLTITIENEAS